MTTTTSTPRRERGVRLGLAAGLLLIATGVQAAVTTPFTAHFKVTRGHLALGTTTFTLKAGARPGCYIYSGEAEPNAIAHLFIGKVVEQSRFCINADGVLLSRYFNHHIAGNKKKSYTLEFDWANHRVSYTSETGKHKTLTLGDRAYDPLSIQIAARRWVARAKAPATLGTALFPLVDKDKIKKYRLRVSNGGQIKTPGGNFDTLLVERIDNHHKIRFWLARYANWLPVRIENQKDKDQSFRMNLTAVRQH